MCSPLWPLNSLHSIWTTEIFCLCLRSESSTPSSIVEKMNWNTHEIYYYSTHNTAERLDLELGSNTTEKFQNLLKNFKTHEAQPSEFSTFSVSFQIFPWCLKAKFQIPPLRRRMFVINITTRGASRPYVSWLSSPTTLHHDCIASRPHPSGSW